MASGSAYRGGSYRGGSIAGRSMNSGRAASSRMEASNIRPAINDGQWHSFGNSAVSARGANSTLVARNTAFVTTRAGFVGAGPRFAPGFRSVGFRGGFGCCWGGFGWGFGVGWPFWGAYWGPYWGFAWNPWWYNPYWYGPGYYGYGPYYDYGYDDYGYDWSDDPPAYRAPEPSSDQGNYATTPQLMTDWSSNPPPYRPVEIAENTAPQTN